MEKEITNRVANSALVQIDLDEWAFASELVSYDLSQNLFQGLLLKEKDFRDFIAGHDWRPYQNKDVAVHCSTDAIIPNWAYMLLASAIERNGGRCHFGTEKEVREGMLLEKIHSFDFSAFSGKKVLLKGCGKMEVSPEVYMTMTRKLIAEVDSLMFGEACSSVPVFKKGRQK